MDFQKLKDELPGNVVDLRNRRYEDFIYDESQDAYWDIRAKRLLSAVSVNGAVPEEQWITKEDGRGNGKLISVKPSITINSAHSGQRVEGATWWPGKDTFIHGLSPTPGGMKPLAGCRIFNTYDPPMRPPKPKNVDASMWIEHLRKLWTEQEVQHFIKFAAHAVQRPDEKVNHAIVLAGTQGLGKDLALWPVRKAVGAWNSCEIEPEAVLGKYNGHMRSVLLVINEIHAAEATSITFYEKCKTITATAGEYISIEEKYVNPIHIPNLVHVFMTTNNPMDMYIPANDRRIFMMWSMNDVPLPQEYFAGLKDYYDNGGYEAIANYLYEVDLSGFNPKSPPPITKGKEAVQAKTDEVRNDEFDDMMNRFVNDAFDGEKPDVIFPNDLVQYVGDMAFDDKDKLLKIIRGKSIAHRLNRYGYLPVPPPEATEWGNRKTGFRSRKAYVRKNLDGGAAINAAASAVKKRPLTFNS